jgi:protein TonB
MFEQALMKRQKSQRRGLILTLALASHGVVVGSALLASAWQVDPVAPPDVITAFTPPIDVTHIVFDQPEPKPAQPPPASPPTKAPSTAPATPAQPPQDTQPPTIPDTVPTPAAGPSADDAATTSDDSTSGDTGGGTDPNAAPGPGGDGDVAIALDARMTRPDTLVRVQPRYPEAARIARRQGTVVVQATIDRTGAVTDVRLVKAIGFGLDEAAMTAVKQWRFRPATLGGRPVPVFFQLTVRFGINN